MRIVGGIRKGMRLKSVPGSHTRPTADMVKEALFNILGERVVGADVLDLFAGSGSLGIEALSRGARRAVFVEKDRKACGVIRANLQRTALAERAVVLAADVFPLLQRPARLEGPFDVVFADPPYRQNVAAAAVEAVAGGSLLATGGLLVVEHHRREELPPQWENIAQTRSRRFGDTVLTFYKGGP